MGGFAGSTEHGAGGRQVGIEEPSGAAGRAHAAGGSDNVGHGGSVGVAGGSVIGGGGDVGDSGGVEGDGDAGRGAGGEASAMSCGVSGLVAYYPFDSDTDDHAGGHDIVAVSTSAVAGVRGRARHFDGVTSTMQVTNGGSVTGARSLCAWVMPELVTGLGEPLFALGTPGLGDFFSVQSATPTGDCAGAALEGEPFIDHWGTACHTSAGSVAHTGDWSLVCYAYDGFGTLQLTVDAVTASQPGTLYDYDLSTLTVGSSMIGGTTTQAHFSGAIDEVTIWDHALTLPELAALWGGGVGCAF